MTPTKSTYVCGLFLAISLGWSTHLRAASTIQFSTSLYTVVEDAGTVTLAVLRTNDVNTTVTVDYTSVDGTATNGVKYTAVSGTLTFAAGMTNQAITVPILNDSFVEPSREFTVSLSNPTGGAILGVYRSAIVSIKDNDTGVAFEFANYWVNEGEESVQIGVVRGDDGDFPVTVDVSSMHVTAQAGSDYEGLTNTVDFALGEKVKLFTVPILNDGLKEASETFRLILNNPGGGAVLGSPSRADVTIVDNDPGVQFTRNRVWVHEQEGLVLLTVTRGNDQLLDAFTVDCATMDGTAMAGTDYATTKETLSFARDEMTRPFSVPILDDGVAKKDRMFKVTLSSPSGGLAVGNTTATVTICDVREMLPHHFAGVRASADGTVSLTLGGGYTPGLGLSNRFQPYFDIYPIEVSPNLRDWTPLAWLVRTNASTNALTWFDHGAAQAQQRYYRMRTDVLVTPNAPPSGPYLVGRMDRWLTDPTRRNRFLVSTNSSFQVAIWYPAEPQAGSWPLPCQDEPVLLDLSYWPVWTDRVPWFVGYARGGLGLAAAQARYPVILMSAGYNALRDDLWEKAEEMASHGYVVLAPEHPDAMCVVLPDGAYESGTTGKEMTVAGFRDRVRDLGFVADQVEQWNQSDPFFRDRLDLDRVGAMGFSWGGATAGEFSRIDPRCRAVVVLDPSGTSVQVAPPGPPKPSITINSTFTDSTLFAKAIADATWFQVSNTEHLDLGGSGWYPSGNLIASEKARDVNRTVNAYMIWFLNKYLQSRTNPMPALKDYPRVINFKQK